MPGCSLVGSLAGATFRFATANAELASYAATHLAPLLAEGVESPQVTAVLRWHEGQPPRERTAAFSHLSGMERIDRDLYVASENLHWFRVDDFRDLYLRVHWQNERLTVEGDFYHRLAKDPRRDRAKRLLYRNRLPGLRNRRFTTLLYYMVYYPCWSWLELTQGLHPIHAAGVSTDMGVILLGGASGVGKSTLAVALASLPRARLLSDSFVLHNGSEVFAVREPILLDAWSRRWLGVQGDELQPIDWRYCLNRGGYQLPPHRLVEGGRASVLLLPRRSPGTYVKRISSERAHQRLSAADIIINDLRRYWVFAAIVEHLVPSGLVVQRETQLAALTAQLPCYEIGLTADMSCAAVIDCIKQLMPETSRHLTARRSDQLA